MHQGSGNTDGLYEGTSEKHGTNGVPFLQAPFSLCEPPNFKLRVACEIRKKSDRTDYATMEQL